MRVSLHTRSEARADVGNTTKTSALNRRDSPRRVRPSSVVVVVVMVVAVVGQHVAFDTVYVVVAIVVMIMLVAVAMVVSVAMVVFVVVVWWLLWPGL